MIEKGLLHIQEPLLGLKGKMEIVIISLKKKVIYVSVLNNV